MTLPTLSGKHCAKKTTAAVMAAAPPAPSKLQMINANTINTGPSGILFKNLEEAKIRLEK